MKPVFSVVLPTFNRPEMFERAVASVQAQTFEDFELIVIDDGSELPYVDSSICRCDPRVSVIRNPLNRGVSTARNMGIAAAQGEYISFIDDDDEYLPTFLSSTYERFKNAISSVVLSWCSVRCIDHASEATSPPCVSVREFATDYPNKQFLFEELLSIGTGFGVTIKAHCFREIGMFDVGLRAVEDTDLFLRVLAHGSLPVVVPGVHMVLHHHRSHRLTGMATDAVRIRECEILLQRYPEFLDHYPSLRQKLLGHVGVLRQALRWGAGEPR